VGEHLERAALDEGYPSVLLGQLLPLLVAHLPLVLTAKPTRITTHQTDKQPYLQVTLVADKHPKGKTAQTGRGKKKERSPTWGGTRPRAR